MKKIFVLFSVLAILLVSSVTALAETKTWYFYLEQGDLAIGYPAQKADSEQRAYITVTSSDFVDSDRTYFRVYDSDINVVAGDLWINKNDRYTLPYATTAYAGRTYYLGAYYASDLWVNAEGRWTP